MKWTAKSLWFHFFKKKWPIYIIGTLTVALTALAQVLSPKIIAIGIDFFQDKNIPSFLIKENKTSTFYFIFLVFIANNLLLMAARAGWRITLARLTHQAAGWLRAKVWEHSRYFSKHDLDSIYTIGNLMNASTSDVNAAKFIYGFTLVAIMDVVFLGSFTLIAMILIDWKMSLLAICIYPILPIFMQKLGKLEMLKYDLAQDFLTKFNDEAARAIQTIRLQRLTNTGEFWRLKLNQAADEYRGKRLDLMYTSFRYYPLFGISTIFSYLILFSLGIKKVIDGQMSIGEFVAFQSFVFLIQDPLMESGFIVSEWQRARAGLNRLAEIFNHPKDQNLLEAGVLTEESTLAFEVDNLNFKYPNLEKQILNNLSFKLPTNGRLGILGPIGTGKTTLIQILTGLEKDFQGSVLFNNKNIKDYAHLDLRQQMAIVSQKSFLFADTVRNNVKLDSNSTDQEIWDVLEMAGLAEDVKGFPSGLDTALGEWGINLSGGQKQRLTLARALIRKPKYLFLDDCLSAVDTVTEEKILKALDIKLKDSTIIWVAHRKSTLKYCNQIIELQGAHHE